LVSVGGGFGGGLLSDGVDQVGDDLGSVILVTRKLIIIDVWNAFGEGGFDFEPPHYGLLYPGLICLTERHWPFDEAREL
jgi:hypothetical protein